MVESLLGRSFSETSFQIFVTDLPMRGMDNHTAPQEYGTELQNHACPQDYRVDLSVRNTCEIVRKCLRRRRSWGVMQKKTIQFSDKSG